MNTLIEYSALLAGLVVFVLLVLMSWAFGAPRRPPANERYVPGNWHPHAHSSDHHFGDHSV
jgi:hypothetical protein